VKPKRGLAGPFTLQLARHIGRRDYASAIAHLQTYLQTHPGEVAGWTLLAQCHRLAGSDARAIESATAALRHDAGDFSALKMLSEIHASRNEHEVAVAFIRRGLENFPLPSPPMPRILLKTFRLAALLLPKRLGASIESDLPGFEDPDRENRTWFAWAKNYLRWYDGTTGNSSTPSVH